MIFFSDFRHTPPQRRTVIKVLILSLGIFAISRLFIAGRSPLNRIRLWFRMLLAAAPIAASTLAHAQGGPPFITDDPGTPGNKQWEINFGWVANHNPGASSYQLPDIDINYGLGDRIQLKYEIPVAAVTDLDNTTLAGLGESFPGVKWRFYEHHTAGEPKSDGNMNFSLGTYPQALINNPTSAVRRGIVQPGPQYYLPLEATIKCGPIDFDGEVGHWFGNRLVPNRWGRGLIAGHEFSSRLELYAEIYDLQDDNQIGDAPKQRALTADIGGRQTLDHAGHLRLLFMGGRGLQAATRQNSEPDWIAYIGLQVLVGPKVKEVPGEKP
jgi:hypothetical protein